MGGAQRATGVGLVGGGVLARAMGVTRRRVYQLSVGPEPAIPSLRPTGAGGHRRYDPRAVLGALEARGGTIPEGLRVLAGLPADGSCPCEGPEEDPGPHLHTCPWSDPDYEPEPGIFASVGEGAAE